MTTRRLKPDEAADMFSADPSSIFVRLPEFLSVFGLTLDELLPDLTSGRLQAVATRTALGYEDVMFSGAAIIQWMVTTGRTMPEMAGEHDPRAATLTAPLH